MKVYKTTLPSPLLSGPLGYMQYSLIVTADTKAEAAELAGLRPRDLEWKREPERGWTHLRALLYGGFLEAPGAVYYTGATRGDNSLVWQRAEDGSWTLIGRVEYRDSSMYKDPYIELGKASR